MIGKWIYDLCDTYREDLFGVGATTTPCYPAVSAPDAVYPMMTYQVIDTQDIYTYTSHVDLKWSRVQINIVAQGSGGYTAAWAIADALRGILHALTVPNTRQGVIVYAAMVQDTGDLVYASADTFESRIYGARMDLSLGYKGE